MGDEQLPKVPRRYTHDEDTTARESAKNAIQSAANALTQAKGAIDNANLAAQAAANAYLESISAMNEYSKLNNPPAFVSATLINGFTAETNRPVKYASLLAKTTRYIGAAKAGSTRKAGTRVFQLGDDYRPSVNTYLPVTVKDLPKGGITLNALSILGVTLLPGIGEGMTTGMTLLQVSTDGWVTLVSDLPAGCTLVFDGATNVKSTS
jgi:hypothetical protein